MIPNPKKGQQSKSKTGKSQLRPLKHAPHTRMNKSHVSLTPSDQVKKNKKISTNRYWNMLVPKEDIKLRVYSNPIKYLNFVMSHGGPPAEYHRMSTSCSFLKSGQQNEAAFT